MQQSKEKKPQGTWRHRTIWDKQVQVGMRHREGFSSYLHKYLEGFDRSFTMKHSPPFTQKVFSFSAHFMRWLVPVVDVDVDEEVFAPSVETDILMGDSEDT